MSLRLVITVACLALADAGYQYQARSASFSRHGNQPPNFLPRHGPRHHTTLQNEFEKPLTHSISYKDYVYSKQDNVRHNRGNHGSVNHAAANGGIRAASDPNPTASPITNRGYVHGGYAQSFAHTPTVNLDNSYAQNYAPVNNNYNTRHVQNFLPITSENSNGGYSQTLSLYGSNSNIGLAQNSISSATGSSNIGYAQTSVSAANHLNNAYTHISVPAVSNNLISGNVQTLTPSVKPNLNTGYSHGPTLSASTGLNHGYTHTVVPSAISNTGSQTLATSVRASLSNGYSESPASSTHNTAYSQNFVPSGTASLSTSYAQTSLQSPSGSLINSHSQAEATSGSAGVNHVYAQTSLLSASGNLNKDYSHILVPYSSSSATNNGYAQTSIASASSNSNTGYSQPFPTSDVASSSNGYSGLSIPTAVSGSNNYNTDYSHSLSSGTVGTINGFAQTSLPPASSSVNTDFPQLATSNLNTGYSQTLVPSGSGSLNSGYSQTSSNQISTGINNVYGTPASFSLNNGYSQISTTPLKVNLNPTLSFDTSINGDDIQPSTGSANSNIGFPQIGSNFNEDANIVSVSNSAPAPLVFKDIYFHVPPPDVEDQRAIPPPPPAKKNYKILFIKVPSQDSKPDLAHLQHIAEISNAAASVEHKTLIYVLVKNPETQEPVTIPEHTPSEHEVFFVKYNGNPLDIAAEVNDELEKSGTVHSIVPLEAGLGNGKK